MWKNLRRSQPFLLTWIIVIGLILTFKNYGLLQPFEWMVFDTFMQLRPKEPVDRRIVIVAFTQNDIETLDEYPISDGKLAMLLSKIKQQKPVAIGLDIYRDIPVEPGHEELVKVFKTTPNLFGIQKVLPPDTVKPPPVLEELGQVSTVDTIADGDRKIRRTLLFPTVEGSEKLPNLGLALAWKYLEKQGIEPKPAPDKSMQLKDTTFPLLQGNDGGYSSLEIDDYQILTNYRGPAGSFATVSVSEVLANNVPPNLMTDRIVIIGNTAENVKDLFSTPYSNNLESTPEQMTGAELNANIASQVVSAVLDNRSLLRFLPEEVEYALILSLNSLVLIILWKLKPGNHEKFFIIFALKSFGIIIFFCAVIISLTYIAFLNSFWLPVALPITYLVVSSLLLTQYIYFDRIKTFNTLLKQKNKELEEEQEKLLLANLELENKTLALYDAQSILVIALDAANTAIWDWDLQEDEIYIMHNCDKLLGLGNDHGRMSFDNFLSECVRYEDRELLTTQIGHIVDGAKNCQFDFRANMPSSDSRYLEVKGEIHYQRESGKAIRMVGTLSDITLQKTNGLYITGVDRKYKAVMENSFELVILLDKNLDFSYISPSVNRILGYDAYDFYWRNIISYVHPEDVALFDENIKKVSQFPASTVRFTYRHLHCDKSWKILESIVYNCLHDPFVTAFVMNSRDVTELCISTNS